MDLNQLFNEKIKDGALAVINGLADKFKAENGEPGWREAIKVFLQFADGSLPLTPDQQKAIDFVIDKLGLTNEVDALRAFWQKLPEQLRDLGQTLNDYDGEPIKWAILGQDGKGLSYEGMKGPLGSLINFKTKAGLDLTFEALDSAAASAAVGITCAADERFLKIGAKGKLEASAGASISGPVVGATASVDARGSGTLDYYYFNKAEWFFMEALVYNAPLIRSPFDPEGIARVAVPAEGRVQHLAAIQLRVEGLLSTSMGVNVGKTWGTSFNVKKKSLDLDTNVDVGAAVNVGFSSDMTLNGSWDVLVKPMNVNVLSVKIQKDTSKTKTTTFTLDASAGVKGLDTIGDAVIKKYLPDPGGLLTKLNEFANLGNLLKQEVENNLDKLLKADQGDSLKGELVEVLTGDANAGDLGNAIGSAAENTLNNQLNLLEGKVEDAGKKIITDIAGTLKLPLNLGNKLAGKAENEMNALIDNIKSKLESRLKTIIEENQGNLAPLFKPLESVGKKVKGLAGSIDQVTQNALGPVITLLTKYQEQRNKVVKVVKASTDLKLALHYGRELKTTSSSSTLLEFELDTREARARECYKGLMMGQCVEALAAARESDGGAGGITLTGGSFKASASRTLTTDVSFNIFGAEILSKTILDSDVQVELDSSGNITMANSKATMEKTFKALGETRMVRFLNLNEIPGSASLDENTTKIFSSGLSMTYRDQSLKEGELEAYMGSLRKANLISEESLKAADKRYNELLTQAKSEGKKMGGEIGLSLSMSSKDIQTLIDTEDDRIEKTAVANQMENYFSNIRKRAVLLQVVGKWNTRNTDIYAQIKEMTSYAQGEVLIRYDMPSNGAFRNMRSVSPTERHFLHTAQKMGKNAASLVKVIQNIRNAANMDFTETALRKDVDTLNRYNKEMNEALKDWLQIGGFLKSMAKSLGLAKETIPPVTLAFISTIGELCQLGEGGTEFLTPTVKWSILGWKKEIFA